MNVYYKKHVTRFKQSCLTLVEPETFFSELLAVVFSASNKCFSVKRWAFGSLMSIIIAPFL